MNVTPTFHAFLEVEDYGQVGCGIVVPFTKRSKTKVAVEPSMNFRRRTYKASGDSLVGKKIEDGDILVCKIDFELPETFNRVCIVYLEPTNELLAKIVCPNYDGTVTLKAANPNYADLIIDVDSVKIVAIVKKVQKDVD